MFRLLEIPLGLYMILGWVILAFIPVYDGHQRSFYCRLSLDFYLRPLYFRATRKSAVFWNERESWFPFCCDLLDSTFKQPCQ